MQPMATQVYRALTLRTGSGRRRVANRTTQSSTANRASAVSSRT